MTAEPERLGHWLESVDAELGFFKPSREPNDPPYDLEDLQAHLIRVCLSLPFLFVFSL